MSTQISEELFHAQPSTKPCFSYRSGFSALIHLTSPFTLCLYASQISALLSRIFSLISLVQLSVVFFPSVSTTLLPVILTPALTYRAWPSLLHSLLAGVAGLLRSPPAAEHAPFLCTRKPKTGKVTADAA